MKFKKKLKFIIRLLPRIIRPSYYKNITSIFNRGLSRNEIYDNLYKYFYFHLPFALIKHRIFFSINSRGFGEDSFHSMWYLLFSEFKPKNCLEIGVYRGQIITLWLLISKQLKYDLNSAGLAPFVSGNDSDSKYLDNINYLEDTKKNHEYFNLKQSEYCVEYSTSKNAKKFIESKKWDVIFIDGNHDYEIVKSDFELSINNLSDNGFIVMDDSSLYFDFKQKKYNGFVGHPGPSKVAKEIASEKMRLFGAVGHNNIFCKKNSNNFK